MRKVINGYILGDRFGYMQKVNEGSSGHCSPGLLYTNSIKEAELFKTKKEAKYTQDFFKLTLYKIKITEEVSEVK